MFGQKKPSFQPNVKIIDDDQHILYELTNGYELENFILNKNLRSISSRYSLSFINAPNLNLLYKEKEHCKIFVLH